MKRTPDLYTATEIVRQLEPHLIQQRLIVALYRSTLIKQIGNDIDLLVAYIGDAKPPRLPEVIALITRALGPGCLYRGTQHYTRRRHHVEFEYFSSYDFTRIAGPSVMLDVLVVEVLA